MDSRQRFVVIYAAVSLIPFTLLALLGSNDFEIYLSAFAVIYLVLKTVLNPKVRTGVDFLNLALLVLLAAIIGQRILSLLAA